MLYGLIVYQTQNTIVEENDCHFLAKVVVHSVTCYDSHFTDPSMIKIELFELFGGQLPNK
jgi:hypothetical protein